MGLTSIRPGQNLGSSFRPLGPQNRRAPDNVEARLGRISQIKTGSRLRLSEVMIGWPRRLG